MSDGGAMSSTFILVAVSDPVIHPEATHVAAATGHGVIDTLDPREITRLLPRAHAVLVDADTARHIATLDRRPGIHLLAADPGPVDWQAAVLAHAENGYVLPAQAPELLTALGHAAVPDRSTPDGRGTLLAVCGAAGGAGTSVLAAAMARVAARSHPTTLVDAAEFSGGLDLLLGLEETPGVRWPELQLGEGAVSAADLRAALPVTGDGIACLSAARTTVDDPFRLTPEVLSPVLESLRGAPGVAVIDVPLEGTCTDAVMDACDHAVLLIPAELRPAAAAARLVARLHAARTTVTGVVRHRHWSGLSTADVGDITRCPILTELGNLPRLSRTVELGGLPERLPGQLATTARLLLENAGVQR